MWRMDTKEQIFAGEERRKDRPDEIETKRVLNSGIKTVETRLALRRKRSLSVKRWATRSS
jgi:hypothetical protein